MSEQREVHLPEGPVREDLDTLYRAALKVALDAVRTSSAFPPFGLLVRADGTLSGVKAELNPGAAQPKVADVLAQIRSGLRRRAEAGQLRACVVAVDISMRHPEGGPDDGVKLEFEHRDGEPLALVVPYVPDAGEAGEPQVAPAFAVESTAAVFGQT